MAAPFELLTTFPDGTTVHAVPLPEHDVVSRLHDVVHGIVAEALGLEHSPTLWRKAHGQSLETAVVWREEAMVMALEAAARSVVAFLDALARSDEVNPALDERR